MGGGGGGGGDVWRAPAAILRAGQHPAHKARSWAVFLPPLAIGAGDSLSATERQQQQLLSSSSSSAADRSTIQRVGALPLRRRGHPCRTRRRKRTDRYAFVALSSFRRRPAGEKRCRGAPAGWAWRVGLETKSRRAFCVPDRPARPSSFLLGHCVHIKQGEATLCSGEACQDSERAWHGSARCKCPAVKIFCLRAFRSACSSSGSMDFRT